MHPSSIKTYISGGSDGQVVISTINGTILAYLGDTSSQKNQLLSTTSSSSETAGTSADPSQVIYIILKRKRYETFFLLIFAM
jgi:hypothetical protein